MGKAIRNYLIILSVVVIVAGVFVFSAEHNIKWDRTYNVNDTNPYGFYIFSEEIDYFFNKEVKKIAITPYEFSKTETEKGKNNYIFTEEPDITSLNTILSDIEKGSNALFISDFFYNLDTLGVEITTDYFYQKDKALELTTNSFNERINFSDDGASITGIFTSLNEKNTKTLGYIYLEDSKNINFVEISHGKGKIFLYSEPIVFTNYYLKDFPKIRKYTSTIISYLPKEKNTIWFDKNFKEKTVYGNLSFIMSQPALRITWRLMLLGLLLYLIFKGKREQRIIPIIKKPENTTVEFAQSISSLYFQDGDSVDLVRKKITYFLDHIRNTYNIDTQEINSSFIEKLYNKSGKDKELIAKIVHLIIDFEKNQQADEQALINLDKWIQTFWN